MRNRILCALAIAWLPIGHAASQTSMYEPTNERVGNTASAKVQYVVILEVVPNRDVECNFPINTMIMEMPVSREYYESVKRDQEVLTWFRTNDQTAMLGDFKREMSPTGKWTVVVRGKKTVERLLVKAQPTIGHDTPDASQDKPKNK